MYRPACPPRTANRAKFDARVLARCAETCFACAATRKRLTGSDDVPEMKAPHMEEDMDMMMAAQGSALDRMFLEHMLPHHAGAIQMAHNALPNLKEANLETMAESIIESQSEEIAMIRDMLMGL
jgi:uncharacterized protein (DUF305 family)